MLFKNWRHSNSLQNTVTTECDYHVVNRAETTVDRTKIPAEIIEEYQRIDASDEYKDLIYSEFYRGYPNKPFISKDREVNTNWIEQARFFPESIVPKSALKKNRDGLLPGHIYMLYWIDNVHRKRIPSYFEYKYGINYTKEIEYLSQKGLLFDGLVTEEGKKLIKKYSRVIEAHKK